MNKQRRKEIEKVVSQLEDIQADIDALRDEEEEAYDNLPESLQDSERGEAMQEAIDQLEEASSSVGDAIDYLNELV